MIAIVRAVSSSMNRCQLTHLERVPIDVERARGQHRAYAEALVRCGCEVVELAEESELPDSVFVEDTALVTDEVAVLLRPGATERQAEVESVGRALARWRPLERVAAPGRVDGGDVLRLGRSILVGQSGRSDSEGIAQLARLLAPHGYTVRGLALGPCLHLKTAVTEVADGVVLLNPGWVDARELGAVEVVEVDPAEPFAANALRLGDRVVYPTAFPRTADRLRARGLDLVEVDLSELAKAEGAVTCCSLVLSSAEARPAAG